MVWFHGGGFECGSGVSSFYGPDFIMDHDIIYVSVNYRLGKVYIIKIHIFIFYDKKLPEKSRIAFVLYNLLLSCGS